MMDLLFLYFFFAALNMIVAYVLIWTNFPDDLFSESPAFFLIAFIIGMAWPISAMVALIGVCLWSASTWKPKPTER